MIRQMLIISSIFIGLVLMAHACLKNRIPGRIYVILWEIALLRLILDQSSCIRFCIRYIKILIKSDLTFCPAFFL